MAIYPYQLARGQTRWMFTIDLPPAADGRRRQMNRKGFVSREAAPAAEGLLHPFGVDEQRRGHRDRGPGQPFWIGAGAAGGSLGDSDGGVVAAVARGSAARVIRPACRR